MAPAQNDTPVLIEGAPLDELFKALVRLCPGCMEIWGFAYRSALPMDLGFKPPAEALNRRIAFRRRSHEYSPLSLRQGRDGGAQITCACNGIELHLDEDAANDFICYIKESRRNVDKLAARILEML